MSFEPSASYEEIDIRTRDGAMLRAVLDEPAGPPRATLVLAHAMFARKSSFGRRDRPGLAHALVKAGYRTIAFDFRGHGDSTSPAEWTYDDLVRTDMPAMAEFAESRGEEPVIVIGHSLGGHVAMAAQGTGRMHVNGVVGLGAGFWLKDFEPSRLRWAAKQGLGRALLALSERAKGIPARRFRFGSDDASAAYTRDLFQGVMANRWGSADGTEDYASSLSRVTVPYAAVLGTKDRLMCHPTSGEAFAKRLSGPIRFFHIDTDHMGLATSARSWPSVLEAIEWTESSIRRAAAALR